MGDRELTAVVSNLAYFRKLGLTEEEAAHLHHEYYKVRLFPLVLSL